jgi:hypothetical protein
LAITLNVVPFVTFACIMLAALIPAYPFIAYNFETVPSQQLSLMQEVSSIIANRVGARICFKFISSGFGCKKHSGLECCGNAIHQKKRYKSVNDKRQSLTGLLQKQSPGG